LRDAFLAVSHHPAALCINGRATAYAAGRSS
jgi:hypothetical protein